MVANHVTLQRQAALREVAKVYGRPATEIAAVTKRLPWADGGPLPALLATHPNFRSLALGGSWPEIASLAESLGGLPRNLSRPPGGVGIVPDSLTNYMPVEPAAKRTEETDPQHGGRLAVRTIELATDGAEH